MDAFHVYFSWESISKSSHNIMEYNENTTKVQRGWQLKYLNYTSRHKYAKNSLHLRSSENGMTAVWNQGLKLQ